MTRSEILDALIKDASFSPADAKQFIKGLEIVGATKFDDPTGSLDYRVRVVLEELLAEKLNPVIGKALRLSLAEVGIKIVEA